jgi:WD40 repeat protein
MKTQPETPVSQPARGHDLFVSYSRADRQAVVSLTQGLADRGKRAWVDLEDIPPSAEWMAEIRSAIASADGYLVVVSPDLARSKVCGEELEHAREAAKRIVPVLVRPTEPDEVPQILAALNWIDATGGVNGGVLDRVVQALDTDLEHVKAHTRLLVRASEWDTRSEPRSLLLRGEDLKEAETLLVAAQGKEPAPTPVQARYVQSSRQGAARRQRSVLAIAVSVALVAASLGVFAWTQRSKAIEQRALAVEKAAESRSRELAASSIGQLDHDPELSLILATDAMKVARTPEALDALRQALTESHVRATLRGFDGPVQTANFSPDGNRVLAGGLDGTARIWTPGSTEAPVELTGHTDLIDAASFSPDGSLAVTASFDGTARVWDTTTGADVVTLRGHEGSVNDAAFDPTGEFVVTGGEDGTARIWNARTGEQVHLLRGHRRPIYDVSFSPNGRMVVTASDDDTARIWDARTGKTLEVLRGHHDGLYTGSFDRTGRHVVTSSQDGTAKVWDVATGKLVADLVGHLGPVISAAFSPDGREVVTASEDKTARIWDASSGRLLQVLRGHQDQLNSAAFAPDGRSVVTASLDGTARVWNASNGSTLAVLRGHVGPVITASFSPDGQRVVTAGQDGTVRVWEPVTKATLYAGSSSWSSADPAARIVAASTNDGTVTVVSTVKKRELWTSNVGVPQTGVAVSPDATLVVSGGFDGVGHVFDAHTGKEIAELHGHSKGYFSADFYGTSDVLTWSDDGTARLWDPRSGEQLAVFDHGGNIWEAHLSEDGTEVFTTGLGDGVVRMWDVASGQQRWMHSGLLGPPAIGAAISPDGSLVGTVSSQAVIWDARTGKELATLQDPGQIHGLGFLPDSNTVLTRSDDGGARIWDARTGELLVEMRGPSAVNGVNNSLDGRWVASVGKDDVARIYDARTGDLVTTFDGEGGEGVWAAFANQGRSVVTFSSDGIAIDRCDACGTAEEIMQLAETRITRPLTASEQALYVRPSAGEGQREPPRAAGLIDHGQNPVPDGALSPGTYSAVGFVPKLTFRLGSGWYATTSVDAVRPPEIQFGEFVQLQRTDDPSSGLTFLFMDPGRAIDGHKAWNERWSLQPFPRDLAAWFSDHPNFDVLRKGSFQVGGLTGQSVDTLGTSLPKEGTAWPNCGGCIVTFTLSATHMTGPIGDSLTLGGGLGEIDRWIVLRAEDHVIVIDAWSASRADFRRFIPKVNRVIESVRIGS